MTMRKISIKKRIIFWYAFSFLLLLFLIFLILFLVGNKVVRDEAQVDLKIAVDRAVRDVQIVDGQLIIDDDIVYYLDGTYVVVCREDGTIISGMLPEEFEETVPFQEEQIQKIQGGYYLYDRLIMNKTAGNYWVRGIAVEGLQNAVPAMSAMLRIFLIALPILCVLIIFGGWYITRRAFLPLRKVNETAGAIREGGDLSMRLGIGDAQSSDEIRETAAVIDQMLDQIEESFEAEKRFTNDASHELRTPAAVILAECEYAMEHIHEEEKLKEALGVILAQSQRMSTLISELLMLARADRGVIAVQQGEVDVSLLAEEAAMRMRQSAKARDMEIIVDAEAGIYTRGDEALLSRVFENLLDNAIKYGKKGGRIEVQVKTNLDEASKDSFASAEPDRSEILVKSNLKEAGKDTLSSAESGRNEIYVEPGLENGTEQIRIRVWDNGIGIRAEDLPHIWERFFRSADVTSDEASMGLGLPLVKWIVEQHDGKISVNSVYGEGTEFFIVLNALMER